jgi:hypothetical protein
MVILFTIIAASDEKGYGKCEYISFHKEERDNKEIMSLILCSLRLDVDITELHSWITRSEAVLQSSEFAVYRKEGNISDLQEKVNVGSALILYFYFVLLSNFFCFKYLCYSH